MRDEEHHFAGHDEVDTVRRGRTGDGSSSDRGRDRGLDPAELAEAAGDEE